MGISGLLPLLKSIQVTRHLSEFSGQTLAVDAYVWLHRGVYACAMDVATGKKTKKYVEYAMSRVRLLQHFNIQPYIVFDGGPLPAKRGTESERKRKRDENLAEANRLASEGKHAQAREYYLKCVDVTPEMAFQFIKVLRAASVPYVVAPYEADAQLAYLERIGLVDGILTEDSDLLVFGCQNVLFKLDTVASTVISISRSDFGAVTSSDGGISLVGWSDIQFRDMAILSGCDYLPNIPGIGLKTAWSLMRKHKTAERAIRAVNIEGKKEVPRNYSQSLKLVEKVFLYQRVYDPRTEQLVHLNELPAGEMLTKREDGYVGEHIDPLLAKKVAIGDVCPITLLPIVDMHPGDIPLVLKPLQLTLNGVEPAEKSSSILNFFGPKQNGKGKKNSVSAGKASGKRRLSDIMDMDQKENTGSDDRPTKRTTMTHSSRFFGVLEPLACNVVSARLPSPILSPLMKAMSEIEEVEEESNGVIQEDGYLSPASIFSRFDTPEVSSPEQPRRRRRNGKASDEDDFGADVLSSPVNGKANGTRAMKIKHRADFRAPVTEDMRPEKDTEDCGTDREDEGTDLRTAFGDDQTSEIECPETESSFTSTTRSSSSGPYTPKEYREGPFDKAESWDVDEAEEIAPGHKLRIGNVAKGWMERWGYAREKTPLRRMETTVRPSGVKRARR